MDGFGDLLFGPIFSAPQAVSLAFRIVGVVIMCTALVFLARRHEVGWWLAIASFALGLPAAFFQLSTGFPVSPGSLMLYSLLSWLAPLVGVGAGIYGLAAFRKTPMDGPMVRDISLRPFRPAGAAGPLLVAVAFAVAYLLPLLVLSMGLGGSGGWVRFPFGAVLSSGFLSGLLAGGLVGLAGRSRWAWLLAAVSSVVSLGGVALAAQGSVLVFLFMAQAALAVYGYLGWGRLRRDTSGVDESRR